MTSYPNRSKFVHDSKSPSATAPFRRSANPRLSMHMHGSTIKSVGKNVGRICMHSCR
jgi:hypothetical protein